MSQSKLAEAWASLARMDAEIHRLASVLADAPDSLPEDGHALAQVGAAVKIARHHFSSRCAPLSAETSA